MAKHLVKCLYCSQIFDRDKIDCVAVRSNRYAHTECHLRAEQAKEKTEKDKEILEEYIKRLFQYEELPLKIRTQIKTYHEKENFSYSGIHKSLVYFFEIKGNSVEKANGGIGIVPYVYNDAYVYYRSIWEAQQINAAKPIEQLEIKEKVIKIKPPAPHLRHRRKLFTFLNEDATE